jgi:ABC-2 type transport system permease protein
MFRRFFAIFKKEFRQIGRDRLTLGQLLLIPALLLALYGYALSFDVKHIGVAVVDLDRTPASRALLDSLFQNPYFSRRGDLATMAAADDLLAHGGARAVLVIPRGYGKRLGRGELVHVQALVDAADATSAVTAIGYLEAMADRTTQQLRLAELEQAGLPPAIPVIRPEPRIWFNAELNSAKFLVPGLTGMLMMLAAVVATSLSIVREKERGTMEQLMVSPARPVEIILGKTLPYVLICLATMAMILLLGWLLFGVQVTGSWLLLGLSTLIFIFAALSMGLMISAITRSQHMAFEIAILTTLLPSVILSGLIFPIKNMPLPIQGITLLVIPRYFVETLRGIILKDAPFAAIWPNLLGMLILGIAFSALAIRLTKKEN